jgi:hypothetical protein
MSKTEKNTTMNLVAQDWKLTLSDFKKNLKKHILYVVLIYIGYITISSFVILLCEGWKPLHSVYFTIINTTTVGFGDVVPFSRCGKLVACVNAVMGLLFFGCIVALVTMSFQPRNITVNGGGGVSTGPSDSGGDNSKDGSGEKGNETEEENKEKLEEKVVDGIKSLAKLIHKECKTAVIEKEKEGKDRNVIDIVFEGKEKTIIHICMHWKD